VQFEKLKKTAERISEEMSFYPIRRRGGGVMVLLLTASRHISKLAVY